MKNLVVLLLAYTLMLAFGQVALKMGAGSAGGLAIKSLGDLWPLLFSLATNPLVILGTLLLAGSFFLWIYMLSWFQLGLILPLTALTFVFVEIMSYFILGERFSPVNYFGMAMIFSGLFFLLYK